MASGGFRLWLVAIACAVLAVLAPRRAWAIEPVVVSADVGEIPLGRHVEYLEDKDGKLTIDDVQRSEVAARFKPSEWDVPNFGFSTSAYWFRFELENPASEPLERLLQVAYPVLASVQLYIPRSDGSFDAHVTGRRLPFSTREIAHADYVFRTRLRPGPETLFLRIETEGSLQVPLTLWSPVAFIARDQTSGLGTGLFYGSMLVMLAYNLFLFVAVRDRSYLYYALYVSSFLIFQATVDGLVLEYVWPNSPGWCTQFWKIDAMSLAVTMALFTRRFLDLRDVLPRWHRLLTIELWVGMTAMGAAFVASYHTITLVMSATGIALLLGMLATSVRAWVHGVRSARFYVVAWCFLLAGCFTYFLSKLGLAPHTFATEHGWQIGSVLEVVLISFALADRLNQMKADKEKAQAHALVLQRDANETLLREVARQTQELRDQAAKLVELDKQKTHFFQNVSHELRTPLTLILNPLDEMTREVAFSREPRLDVAIKNARRLLRLVNQLLDFQKLAAGKKQWHLSPIDAAAFARSCGEYFAPACKAQGVSFRVDAPHAPDAPAVVNAEADALEKIVFNFLANALKYTPKDKVITLSVARVAGRARIAVTDDGPGISAEGQKRLFQLFSQVDGGKGLAVANEGTGLGLALAKELAEAMGGGVGVESKEGEGSTFWVELPVVQAAATDAKPTGKAMADVAAVRKSEHLSVRPPPSSAEPDATGSRARVARSRATATRSRSRRAGARRSSPSRRASPTSS